MLFYLALFPPVISILVQALSLGRLLSSLVTASLVLTTAYVCRRYDSAITIRLLNTPLVQWTLLEMLLCEWLCRRNAWIALFVSATHTLFIVLRVHCDSPLMSCICSFLYTLSLVYIRLRCGYCQGVFSGISDLNWSDVLDLVNNRGCSRGIVIKNTLPSRVTAQFDLPLPGTLNQLKFFSTLALGSLLTLLATVPLLSSL